MLRTIQLPFPQRGLPGEIFANAAARAFHLFSWALLLMCSFQLTNAAIRFGNETAVVTPASAHYSTAINVRPGNREVVSNNPPIFTWFYNTNHLVGGEQNPNGFYPNIFTWTNAFQFQIATQPNFGGPLAVDVSTPFNFYNFLGPLNTDTTRQFWWRVKYVRDGKPYWTNGPYTFTIAANATDWDRSMLADPNYYATNSVHPMFCYRAGEEAAIWSYAQNDDVRAFQDLINAANAATNAPYWKNHSEWAVNATPNPIYATPAADGYGRANNIGAVLFMHRFSGDERWTNPSMTGWLLTNLSHQVNWFLSPSNNYAMLDYGDSQSPLPLRLCVATYDWLYDYLGANTATFNGRLRTNALHAMRLAARFQIYNDFWKAAPAPTGGYLYFYDWNYANRPGYCVEVSSLTKQDNSHGALSRNIKMMLGMIGGQDDPELKFHREMMLNYYIARTTGFGGWAAHHIGVYGYVESHVSPRQVQSGLMILDVAYPQAQIRRTDFCSRFPEWYSRMMPFGKRLYHGAYGDGLPSGKFSYLFGGKNRGWDLAALTGSGLSRQLYDINRQWSNALWEGTAHWDQIPVRYHFALPPAATNTTSALYPEDGMVVASSKSPSDIDCYTNGVGFSFKASPRGNYQNHQVPDSLSFDLWAYGTQITDGGGGNLDAYGYHADASPGLFVNGYGMAGAGQALYGYSQTVPMEACIVNYTNFGTDFVYCAADGTALFTNSYHPLKNLVKKVKRHVLFARSKYWVVYDQFEAASPATFAFRWHVPWAFRYDVNDVALGSKERVFSGHRIGSNSLSMAPFDIASPSLPGGFNYVAGNYADAAFPNPPRVPVHVRFANTDYAVFRAEGVKDLGVSKTGVIGTPSTNSTLNPFLNKIYATVDPDRAVGMWVNNKLPTKQWNLLTVIVPQQPGVAAPEFTRINNDTIAVTYDGVTETTTFGSNYVGEATFRIDVAGGARPGAPTGIRLATTPQ